MRTGTGCRGCRPWGSASPASAPVSPGSPPATRWCSRWIRHLGAPSALGGTALTLELAGGVLGTLLGGRIADRIGLVRTVQLGNALLVPSLLAMLLCGNAYAALPLVLLVGLTTNISFAVLVKLGQDYLPSRPGTAAGVTLGLAVSAGGLFLPVLGLVADHHGPQGVFVVLAVLPVVQRGRDRDQPRRQRDLRTAHVPRALAVPLLVGLPERVGHVAAQPDPRGEPRAQLGVGGQPRLDLALSCDGEGRQPANAVGRAPMGPELAQQQRSRLGRRHRQHLEAVALERDVVPNHRSCSEASAWQ